MTRRFLLLLFLSTGLFGGAVWGETAPLDQDAQSEPAPQPKATPRKGKIVIEDLGNQRLRYGKIEIDKGKSFFTVPGKVIRTTAPLEYLAVKQGGSKAYESMLELEVTAVQFNFAAILIGLDAAKAKRPQFHFDKAQPDGDHVAVFVGWQSEGKPVRVPASELFLSGGKAVEASQWVYTGSSFISGNRYLAELDGTLIGFVHDPSTIIEHKEGVGLGNWGSVSVDPKHKLDVGMSVTVTIEKQLGRDSPVSK